VKRGCPAGLLPLALAACTVYGKVQNPEPALDLRSPLRIESGLRSTHTFDGTPALQVRIWVLPPRGTTLLLVDTLVELRTGLSPEGVVARGELRDSTGARAREIELAGGVERGVTAFLPVPGTRLRPGVEYRLTVAWLLRSAAEPQVERAESTRDYVIRVQRTNYGIALGIGWLLTGTAVAVAGP
jgi:hypothetical protein